MASDDETTDYEFVTASGTSTDACVVLGYRTPFEKPFSAFELDSWVIHFREAKRAVFKLGEASWLTGLWQSLEGTLYVSDNAGLMRINPDLNNTNPDTSWKLVELDAQLMGVWGLNDTAVYTWGRAGKAERMFRFDGTTWAPMPSPGNVSVVHGLAPDLLYAVGYDGLLARWDGRAWTRLQVPVKGHFTGLFVAGPDEVWATTEQGELWEGSSHGWARRAGGFDTLLDVAKFEGEVWVAGGDDGLLRLEGATNELEVVKPNIHAKSFDARGKLLITTKDVIAQTADGKAFTGTGRNVLREHCDPFRPMWLGED